MHRCPFCLVCRYIRLAQNTAYLFSAMRVSAPYYYCYYRATITTTTTTTTKDHNKSNNDTPQGLAFALLHYMPAPPQQCVHLNRLSTKMLWITSCASQCTFSGLLMLSNATEPREQTMLSQKAVAVYLESKQLLPFSFSDQTMQPRRQRQTRVNNNL